MKQAVLLLHGIWMRPVVFYKLSNYLKSLDYQVHAVAYHSVKYTPLENAEVVQAYIDKKINTDALHIVAHSLGGIVALHLLSRYQEALPGGRLVTLGSPVQGSQIAQRVVNWPFFDFALGGSFDQGLSGQHIPLNSGREWGMIAGNQAMGIGYLAGGFKGAANDGTVTVAETFADSLTDHLVLPVSHTRLLFSKQVFEQLACFLSTGHFAR